MTPSATRAEVERLATQLLRADLALETNAAVLRTSGQASWVTWSGSLANDPFTPEGQFASIAEYRRLLRGREFSLLLVDGSIIQLSFQFDRSLLVKHRMVFFPCPLVLAPALLLNDEDTIDLPELFDTELLNSMLEIKQGSSKLAEADGRLRLRSPLRFDYDLGAQAEGHPGAHLHLSDESVRWAMFGPLCLGQFVRFVFRHFFPAAWSQHVFLREWPLQMGNRSVTPTEEQELFIECRPRGLTVPAGATVD